MTTHDQRLARALRKSNESISEVPDSPEARASTVAALEAAMQAAPAAPARSAGWLALAAMLPLMIGAAWWLLAEHSSVGRVEQTGARLSNAELVESGQGSLTLALAGGARVTLESASMVELRDLGSTVLLRRGAVAAEVITRERPFTVEAYDTLVATRAGRFQVKASAGCDGRAEVKVSEGSVSIGEVTLKAGETWPRCAPPPSPQVREPAPVPLPAPAPAPRKELKKLAPPPPRAKEEARLAKQNELYQQAVALQRAGDVAGAVQKLELVLADEGSPLAETALAQKMKWLAAIDRSAACETAREYLQRFPMGFGRADAETLVLESK